MVHSLLVETDARRVARAAEASEAGWRAGLVGAEMIGRRRSGRDGTPWRLAPESLGARRRENGRRRFGEILPQTRRAVLAVTPSVALLLALAEREGDDPVGRADDEGEGLGAGRGGPRLSERRRKERQHRERGEHACMAAQEGKEPRHGRRYGVAPAAAQGCAGPACTPDTPRTPMHREPTAR